MIKTMTMTKNDKIAESNKGRKYMNKSGKTTRVKPDEIPAFIQDGWEFGMAKTTQSPKTHKTTQSPKTHKTPKITQTPDIPDIPDILEAPKTPDKNYIIEIKATDLSDASAAPVYFEIKNSAPCYNGHTPSTLTGDILEINVLNIRELT